MAAKKGRGIFLVYTDLADEKYDEEFNAWYDTEHLPELLSIPGVLDGARYVAVKGGPKYLAAYELASPDVVASPTFKNRPRTPWTRRVAPSVIGRNRTSILGSEIFPLQDEALDRGMAPALQIGRMSVPAAADAEWNAWYNGAYIPGYRTVAGCIYARRFKVVEGEVGYTTVYEFTDPHVSETPAWDHQRRNSSPDSDKMRAHMTMASGSPGVYRRIAP